jgi:hypothetical protein
MAESQIDRDIDPDQKTLTSDPSMDVEVSELLKKKQDRLSKVLSKVDTEAIFTKNVNNLLQN